MKTDRVPQGIPAAPEYGRKRALITSFVFLFIFVIFITSANAEQLPADYQGNVVRRFTSVTVSLRAHSQTANASPGHTKLTITPTTLASGTVSVAYSETLAAGGGTGPYQFAVSGGTVPPGLSLASDGTLAGTPTAAGAYSFTVSASDSTKNERGNATVSLSINANQSAPVSVAVSPTTATLSSGATKQFSASVSNTSNTAVTWTASAGTVSSSGLFTAPSVTSTSSVTVKATSAADSTKFAQATVTVNPPAPVSVSVSPTTATLSSAATKQFTASVSNTSNTAVTWTASAGTISSSGLFTAPSVTSTSSVTVKATSAADSTKFAQATVTVNPVAPVTVAVTPSASSVISAKTQQFAATVSNTSNNSVTWKASVGSISSAGLFTAPTVSSSTSATVTATSVADPTKSANASVTIDPAQTVTGSGTGGDNTYCDAGDLANFGSNDGPATLPQACINTAIANTPSPGSVIPVAAGANLQTALNNAACGDTLQLQAGATFTGVFVLPAKNCDSAHWITIRTSASDAALPPEGTRVTPCYAGVSSLPGRPAFNCASVTNALATIQMTTTQGSGPIQIAKGANYYRFLGLEITRQVGTPVVYGLVSVQGNNAADHIILDRVWLHGTAHDETQRGVELGGMTNFAVVDSFFTDFHCTALTGSCGDAQTVNGGLGSLPMGSYKIVNNFLEASGENILFGGGGATLSPTDIEVRRNHFFKPLVWMKNQPGFVGGSSGNAFVVKNHFEMKNAQRVLVEGNIFEYSWGGFGQAGYSVLMTPKNQSGMCAACQVTDVTVRYNTISHVSGGFQIANVLSDSGAASTAGHSYSIHDVTVDDIQAAGYQGPGVFALILMNTPVLHDVVINHVTAFPPKTMLYVGDVSAGTTIGNFVFTNNVMSTGPYPIWSTGGGTANCAYYDVVLTTVSKCFSPVTFTANALITSTSLSQWPTGDFVTSTMSNVQFANYNGGVGGDYTLLSSSPYSSSGTDGKPLGADISAISSATSGVY